MSHVASLKTEIKDVRAIKAAVRELITQGAKIELLEDAVPRMYSASQHTQKSPFVIRCKAPLFFPPSGPATGFFNGPHPKSKFLAVLYGVAASL